MKSLLTTLVLAATVTAIAPITQVQAATFLAQLSGLNEIPVNNSQGTGTALVTLDSILHTMRVQVSFSGLSGNVTNAHIHSATLLPGTGNAGVATMTPTFIGFPSGAGVKSGTYDQLFDMTLGSSYNSAFIAANGGTPASAEAALFSGIQSGKAYLNIHSSFATGGEIRGFFVAVPEPGTLSLIGGLGIYGILSALRRRR